MNQTNPPNRTTRKTKRSSFEGPQAVEDLLSDEDMLLVLFMLYWSAFENKIKFRSGPLDSRTVGLSHSGVPVESYY